MYPTNDEYDYQVLTLTAKFYNDYPSSSYTEIAHKNTRPYNCLLIQSKYGYFICIPYRSHINHKYAFRFRTSQRSRQSKSGLDYSKIIIITNSDYISKNDAIVDKDEYNETVSNIEFIKNSAQEYINDYVNHMTRSSKKYDPKEFQRIYQYSTLQYFHREVGIL